jgi:hypothetical protein
MQAKRPGVEERARVATEGGVESPRQVCHLDLVAEAHGWPRRSDVNEPPR